MSGRRDKAPKEVKQRQRWPFDPMQPGDHEPVNLPENLDDLHKQHPAPRPEKEKKS